MFETGVGVTTAAEQGLETTRGKSERPVNVVTAIPFSFADKN